MLYFYAISNTFPLGIAAFAPLFSLLNPNAPSNPTMQFTNIARLAILHHACNQTVSKEYAYAILKNQKRKLALNNIQRQSQNRRQLLEARS